MVSGQIGSTEGLLEGVLAEEREVMFRPSGYNEGQCHPAIVRFPQSFRGVAK